METQVKTLNPVVKDGVQNIIFIGKADNILNQRIIVVQDYNDRGRGDGVRMIGLPGGAIEPTDESIEDAALRELKEEIACRLSSLKKFGCYTKERKGGIVNNNYLFISHLDLFADRKTNDPKEVSKILVLSIEDIIDAYLVLRNIHEGSIRLIFHYLNGSTSGHLNDQVTLGNITI